MKLKQICIKNDKIDFQNVKLDFSKSGIYLIQGENGAGKTTLLEHLIFGKNEVCFETKEQERLYAESRENLFAYVPQICNVYKCSILEYITKGNDKVDLELLEWYKKEFLLEDIDFQGDMKKLSGGEKVKISIISALLKETPYVFLDEPTNHMDEDVIQKLSEIINKKSETCTFIIVSHDKRFVEKLKQYHLIKIEQNKIEQIDNKNIQENKQWNRKQTAGKINGKSYKRLWLSINFDVLSLLCFFMLVFIMDFLLTFNEQIFLDGYSVNEEKELKADMIQTYKADYKYDELNKVYTKAKKITIAPEDYKKIITYNDVETIAHMDGVEKMILEDKDFDIKFWEISEGIRKEPIHIFAFPQDTLYETMFYEYAIINSGLGNLIYGRFPYDERNEICLSKNMLETYFKIKVEKLQDVIGKKVVYEGQEYEVVGVLDKGEKMCMVSFKPEENHGFYQYNADTWDDYMKDKKGTDGIEEMLIYTKEGMEEQVFDQLMKTYPAENYDSRIYTKYWIKQYNQDFMLRSIYPFNLILSVIWSIIIVIIKNRKMKLDKPVLHDYANYYVDREKVRQIYLVNVIIQFCLLIGISIIANTIYSKYAYAGNWVLLLDGVIIFGPTVFWSFWRRKAII